MSVIFCQIKFEDSFTSFMFNFIELHYKVSFSRNLNEAAFTMVILFLGSLFNKKYNLLMS